MILAVGYRARSPRGAMFRQWATGRLREAGDLHTDRPERRSRRFIRLQGYDYAGAGAYFVTIWARHRECLFGEIMNGKTALNDAGRMVETVWDPLPIRFLHLELDEFIVTLQGQSLGSPARDVARYGGADCPGVQVHCHT